MRKRFLPLPLMLAGALALTGLAAPAAFGADGPTASQERDPCERRPESAACRLEQRRNEARTCAQPRREVSQAEDKLRAAQTRLAAAKRALRRASSPRAKARARRRVRRAKAAVAAAKAALAKERSELPAGC